MRNPLTYIELLIGMTVLLAVFAHGYTGSL